MEAAETRRERVGEKSKHSSAMHELAWRMDPRARKELDQNLSVAVANLAFVGGAAGRGGTAAGSHVTDTGAMADAGAGGESFNGRRARGNSGGAGGGATRASDAVAIGPRASGEDAAAGANSNTGATPEEQEQPATRGRSNTTGRGIANAAKLAAGSSGI